MRDFTNFKKGLEDIAAESLNTYNTWGRKKFTSKERKTSEEIDKVLLDDNELIEVLILSKTKLF